MATTTDPDRDPILFTPELSQELGGIPYGTIRYWEHIGTGPKSFKIGRRRAWRLSEVRRWLAEQESATSRAAARA